MWNITGASILEEGETLLPSAQRTCNLRSAALPPISPMSLATEEVGVLVFGR